MTESTESALNELGIALAKAQAAISAAAKDATNPHYKSKYADLASIWNACREPLTTNGLSVLQLPAYNPDPGIASVKTILLHTSGQSVESVLCAPVARQDAQGIGSALTYLRRYALAAVVGVAPDDDDGEAASGRQPRAQSRPANVSPDGEVVPITRETKLTFGKKKGTPLKDLPDSYLTWMIADGRTFGSPDETRAWQEAARLELDTRREDEAAGDSPPGVRREMEAAGVDTDALT